MARSAGMLVKPEVDGAYQAYRHYRHLRWVHNREQQVAKVRRARAATWRLPGLTSSHRLVCWQPVNKATANSSPWCSWAGGTHNRLTHQGSSSWCANVSCRRVELFPPSLRPSNREFIMNDLWHYLFQKTDCAIRRDVGHRVIVSCFGQRNMIYKFFINI